MKTKSLSQIFLASTFALFASCSTTPAPVPAENAQLPLQWSGCDACAQPESAYFDRNAKSIFVSNVDGTPDGKDKKGSIQKLSLNGKMKNARWITGLNAPKGLRSQGEVLFVADIDEIVAINIKSGKIIRKVAVPNAKMLNDIAIKNGILYVSDTLGSKIYSWDQKSAPREFIAGDEVDGPNGLVIDGNNLIVAGWGVAASDWSTKIPGKLLKIDLKTKKISAITSKPLGNLDGLEKRKNGNYLVSDFVGGKVYEVSPNGETKLLLSGLKGSADLGWNEATATLLVPEMGANRVSAYKLK